MMDVIELIEALKTADGETAMELVERLQCGKVDCSALSANGGEASEIIHVGFTNPAQIGYAKDESGFFYPDTDNQCYIPLYMLKRHLNRMGPDYAHPAPPSVAVPDWANRHTDTPEGWVNELLTLSDHPGKIPSFARDAMRLIAKGLIESISNDGRVANNSSLNEIKAQTLERFADWLKRQSFAHNKRWTSAANEALRCAKRLRPQEKEEQ